jgi:hypothetical protein
MTPAFPLLARRAFAHNTARWDLPAAAAPAIAALPTQARTWYAWRDPPGHRKPVRALARADRRFLGVLEVTGIHDDGRGGLCGQVMYDGVTRAGWLRLEAVRAGVPRFVRRLVIEIGSRGDPIACPRMGDVRFQESA